jgi:4-amino-4-deoxychorismate lyase
VGILPGVVRSQLIHWLQAQDYPVQEADWDRERVLKFEAIAYTNSVMQVIPIHTVLTSSESLTYNPSHPHLVQLQSLWQRE